LGICSTFPALHLSPSRDIHSDITFATKSDTN
jgi:hypothetical protein